MYKQNQKMVDFRILDKRNTVSVLAVEVKSKVKLYTLWGEDLAAHAPQ